MHSLKPVKAFVPDSNNTRQLRDAFGKFATGVTVVTVQSDHGPLGITANSFSSVSLDPAMALWCPDKSSKRFMAFARAPHYAVHILAEDQADLCWQIARDGLSLGAMDLDVNAEGVPILQGCLARFECLQSAIHDAGDHAIILGQILRASHMEAGEPLTFYGGTIRGLSPSKQ